jgi:hypothetical protein
MSSDKNNPPSEWFNGTERVGDSDVYVLLGATPSETIVWHWCPVKGHWEGAYISLHTIVSREPLTITASLYRPDCCGWHGFITDGQWVAA